MPANLYTKQDLFILRNDIPVDSLIKELKIPFKVSEGYFRFCCPECREFNTSVNPKTNLARCFRCKINYNTIDLVKIVRGWNFKNSVEFLKKFQDKKSKTDIPPQSHQVERTTKTNLVPISNILETILPTWNVCGSTVTGNQKVNNEPKISQLNERILRLEQQVKYLSQKIEIIEQKNYSSSQMN